MNGETLTKATKKHQHTLSSVRFTVAQWSPTLNCVSCSSSRRLSSSLAEWGRSSQIGINVSESVSDKKCQWCRHTIIVICSITMIAARSPSIAIPGINAEAHTNAHLDPDIPKHYHIIYFLSDAWTANTAHLGIRPANGETNGKLKKETEDVDVHQCWNNNSRPWLNKLRFQKIEKTNKKGANVFALNLMSSAKALAFIISVSLIPPVRTNNDLSRKRIGYRLSHCGAHI